MPKPFVELSLDAFIETLELVDWTRRVDAVHLHHTFRPNHTQFAARPPIDAIDGMFRFHTAPPPAGRGFSDIAQHVTLDPRGVLWTGRNWNVSPASATGFNGNSVVGPFMIEMIGDFDLGKDRFDAEQKRVAVAAVAALQKHFGLPPDALRFHRQLSTKTCPGTAIDRDAFIEEVRLAHAAAVPSSRRRTPVAPAAPASLASARDAAALMSAGGTRTVLTPRAVLIETELDEELMTAEEAAAVTSAAPARGAGEFAGLAARGEAPLTPEETELLRRHVVNLRFGALSDEGDFATSRADVDRLFAELIPEFFQRQTELGRTQQNLAIYAHGGLIDERGGLANVLKKARFWTDNGIYPLFFVWETGLKETVADLVRGLFTGGRAVAARGPFDDVADVVLEALASEGGQRVWGFMKRSAEVAVAPGGALLVAEKIRDLWATSHQTLRLHAVGHSAGAIFHAHFVPAVLDQKVQAPVPPLQIATLQLLAPAVTTALFKRKLKPRIGARKGVASCVEYTMLEGFERADTAGPYRKSLLYFVSRAFEPVRPTPILGLEESVRDDAELMLLFGVAGSKKQADLVFSPTPDEAPRQHASRAVRHGDFDDDPSTMNSVFRRILDVPDDQSIVEFPDMRNALSPFDLPPAERVGPQAATAPVLIVPSAASSATGIGTGGRRALCVGIDAYPPPNALGGCVNDAETWGALLSTLGFDTTILRNQQATRSGLVRALEQLVASARPGDVLVFQFAGHGTQVRDLDADEPDSQDEAFCPVDFAAGALLIDDDLHDLLAPLPAGVNLTAFIDCCHSGTITRAVELRPAPGARAAGRPRARFVPRSQALDDAHARFRRGLGGASAARSARAPQAVDTVHGVLFSACQDREVAFEVDGAGDFTRHAASVLRSGIDGLTHEAFLGRVLNVFGPTRRQTPNLYPVDPAIAVRGLLQPLGNGPTGTGASDFAKRLADIERRLEGLGT